MIPEIFFKEQITCNEIKKAIASVLNVSESTVVIIEHEAWMANVNLADAVNRSYFGEIYDEEGSFCMRLCSYEDMDKDKVLDYLTKLSFNLKVELWVFDSFFSHNFEEFILKIVGSNNTYTLFYYKEPDEGGLEIKRIVSPENLSKEELFQFCKDNLEE